MTFDNKNTRANEQDKQGEEKLIKSNKKGKPFHVKITNRKYLTSKMGCSSSKHVAKGNEVETKGADISNTTSDRGATPKEVPSIVEARTNTGDTVTELNNSDRPTVHVLARHDSVEENALTDYSTSQQTIQAPPDSWVTTTMCVERGRLPTMPECRSSEEVLSDSSYSEQGTGASEPVVEPSLREPQNTALSYSDHDSQSDVEHKISDESTEIPPAHREKASRLAIHAVETVSETVNSALVSTSTWLLPATHQNDTRRLKQVRSKSSLFDAKSTKSDSHSTHGGNKSLLVYGQVVDKVLPPVSSFPTVEDIAVGIVFGKPRNKHRAVSESHLSSPKRSRQVPDSAELLSWNDLAGYFAQLPTLWGDVVDKNGLQGRQSNDATMNTKTSLPTLPTYSNFRIGNQSKKSPPDSFGVDETMVVFEEDEQDEAMDYSFRSTKSTANNEINPKPLTPQHSSVSTVAAT